MLLGGFLYLAQLVSSVNFELAQRLGIQEEPRETDSLLQTAERHAAYWDLVTLAWLPLAGLLMIFDHAWWPIIGLIGGAIYLDTSGREAAKMLAFRKEGVRTGPEKQHRVFFATYIVMGILGLVAIAYSAGALV